MDLPLTYGTVNTIFYVLAGFVTYHLTLRLTASRSLSLFSSIMLLTSFPIIAYRATSSKEGTGVFFQVLTALLALKLTDNPKVKKAVL